MAQQSIDNEKRLWRKIDRHIKENDIDLLFDIDDITEAISNMHSLVNSFEDVHVSLQRDLGDEQYTDFYADYDKRINVVTDWTTRAKLAIKDKKSAKANVHEETQRQEQFKILSEEKYLREKITRDLRTYREEDSHFVSDLTKNVAAIEDLQSQYTDLFRKVDGMGVDVIKLFGDHYEIQSGLMNNYIRDTRKRIQEKKLEEQDLIAQRNAESERREKLLERESKINLCQTLYQNVVDRAALLRQKCGVDFSNLSDSGVLDLKKDSKILDSDYSDILDRISKLGESNPCQFRDTHHMMVEVTKIKSQLLGTLDNFKAELDTVISERDLSKEKIQNSALLGIELPKFKGYDSPLDYYSFKSEFEKLIAPRVQAKLLPDHLKNNYLEGQAFQVVKEMTDIDEIWARLRQSFGNVTTLLSRKIRQLESGEPFYKIKNDGKRVSALIKFKNTLIELSSLAEKHDIQSELYHSSNLSKVFQQVGRDRQRKIMRNSCREVSGKIDHENLWNKIVDHVSEEILVSENMNLFSTSVNDDVPKDKIKDPRTNVHVAGTTSPVCDICGRNDHVANVYRSGKQFVSFFACEKLSQMSTKERFEAFLKNGLCLQCAIVGNKMDHGGRCFDNYCCPHDSHKKFDKGVHVLICHRHKDNPENKKLFESFKSKFITFPNSSHKDFSKTISLFSAHVAQENSVRDVSIYMLQSIELDGHTFNIMFDDGCNDACFRKGAIEILIALGRARCTLESKCSVEGVGGLTSIAPHGRYAVTLPLFDGTEVELEGICLDVVTGEFPTYPLGEVEKELREVCAFRNGDLTALPRLPLEVGGETDIMIGSQYLKYCPEKVFKLENGFSLYESYFSSPDGSRGVVCGPHRFFTEHLRQSGSHHATSAFFSEAVLAYKSECCMKRQMTLLSDFAKDESRDIFPTSHPRIDPEETDVAIGSGCHLKRPSNLSQFEEVESAGTEVSYRCVRCRGCPACKQGGKVESISIQEEIEQEVINKSVVVHLDKGYTIAKLPFLCDPHHKLAPNVNIARKVYNSQLRKINSNPKTKSDIIAAERKLHDLGYVAFYDDLTENQKAKIQSSPTQHYYPWRIVENKNSKTTPYRPVFDASMVTSTGFCLNDLVAKGRNNLNNLVMIFIRWMTCRFAFHTDVQKMYNSILLSEEDWAYQLYLWDPDLNPNVEPRVKVIKTIIYGVKSSGNQAERGFRETARLQKEEFPRVFDVVQNDTYVDDCFSGEDTSEERNRTTDRLPIVLSKGGFSLKGYTFSGSDPPDDLKQPDNSINVAGMKWFSKADRVGLNLGEMKFGKSKGGRKIVSPVIPDSFTRRDCAGRVAEMFDLVGKCTPLVAGFKLDLRELSKRKLDWDDSVPDDLLGQWKKNFKTISDVGELRYKRLIIPDDAVDLNMDTIEISDASLNMACAAVYGRFRRKSGGYSCQLIFARSKIIPDGVNIPRAELIAAVLNATTGHIVSSALDELIVDRVHLVDNQIVLFWITNRRSVLKLWLRNRVQEITRLTDREKWFFIDSENNMADLGTRKGVKIDDIVEGSSWINGPEWARQDRSSFPIKSVDELRLSQSELLDFNSELNDLLDEEWINQNLFESYSCRVVSSSYTALSDDTAAKVRKRYEFSNYILDPNKFRFKKVVRVLALVYHFISNTVQRISEHQELTPNLQRIHKQLQSTTDDLNLPKRFGFCQDYYLVTEGKFREPFVCEKGKTVVLSERFLRLSLNYYFRKGTLEIVKFSPKSSYEKISKEVQGILRYTGRILPTQVIDNHLQLADVCLDLTDSTFCVPLLDKYSPISFSIINEVHWYDDDARHAGNETVWRFVQLLAFIVEGKPLAKQFKEECPRCRYLKRMAIKVAMGPVGDDQLRIAPPFYASQVDIFGPYKSHSDVNTRAKTDIWFVIFCCCVTGAVSIKTMNTYSTKSFVMSFIRFSCVYGCPYKLLPDAGSQLVKGCKSMKLTFTDIKNRLHEEGVVFEVCPVGAHYMHGKVERKIRSVKETFAKCLQNEKLSGMEWETLGDQVANSMNNLPIGLKSETKDLENIDLLTPNRLLLGRNNNRGPVGPLRVTEDVGKIVEQNEKLVKAWFRAWLISYVPNLVIQPKWFRSDRDPKIGDIVLFLKSDKEFKKLYQYGMIHDVKQSRDGLIREVEIIYQNSGEKSKRFTSRGTREIVVIHHVEELGLIRELNFLASNIA